MRVEWMPSLRVMTCLSMWMSLFCCLKGLCISFPCKRGETLYSFCFVVLLSWKFKVRILALPYWVLFLRSLLCWFKCSRRYALYASSAINRLKRGLQQDTSKPSATCILFQDSRLYSWFIRKFDKLHFCVVYFPDIICLTQAHMVNIDVISMHLLHPLH